MSSSAILQCSDSQRIALLKIYGRTPETVIQDIKNIKEWTKITHLPETIDESVIERFLLLNKFNLEKTKEKLEMYHRVRSIIPELYDKNPNDPTMQKIMDMVLLGHAVYQPRTMAMCDDCSYFMPLPKLTSELHRVIVIKAIDTNADNFNVIVYLAHTLNIAEVRLREDYNLSEIHVYDLSGLQVGHFTKFTPSIIRKGTFVLEKVFSNRSRGIHYINAPRFVGPFISLLKVILSRKLADSIFVHKDMESLYKVIPKDILPKEYGGNEKSLVELNDEWKKKFLEYDSLFQHIRGPKVADSPRFEEPVHQDVLEAGNSFRQLELD